MAPKPKPVFDKKKPYGYIVNHGDYRYEQNGHYFDVTGKYVEPAKVVDKKEDDKDE